MVFNTCEETQIFNDSIQFNGSPPLNKPLVNLFRYRWNHGLAAASLSGTEGDDEDEDEGEEDGEEDTAGAAGGGVGGGARGLRWKDALHDRAAAAFSRRQKTNVDLMALVYVIHVYFNGLCVWVMCG